MLTAIITGLAIGALYAAAALAYNVMYSTSKVLSVTTGHIFMVSGVVGAYLIGDLKLPIIVGLFGSMVAGVVFGLVTEFVAIRRVLSRSRRAPVAAQHAGARDHHPAGGGPVVGHRAEAVSAADPAGLHRRHLGPEVLAADRDGGGADGRPRAVLPAHPVRQDLHRRLRGRVRGAGARRRHRPGPGDLLRHRRRCSAASPVSPPGS